MDRRTRRGRSADLLRLSVSLRGNQRLGWSWKSLASQQALEWRDLRQGRNRTTRTTKGAAGKGVARYSWYGGGCGRERKRPMTGDHSILCRRRRCVGSELTLGSESESNGKEMEFGDRRAVAMLGVSF